MSVRSVLLFCLRCIFLIYFNALCREAPPEWGPTLMQTFPSVEQRSNPRSGIQLLSRGAVVTNRCSVINDFDKLPGNSFF